MIFDIINMSIPNTVRVPYKDKLNVFDDIVNRYISKKGFRDTHCHWLHGVLSLASYCPKFIKSVSY